MASSQNEGGQQRELESVGAVAERRGTELPREMQLVIEQRRQMNVLVAAIVGTSWGQNMSTTMRRAYAQYCHEHDVDPVTEMDNLGGNVYVNSEWYLRKLGELRRRGIVKDFELRHIQNDPRLRAIFEDEKMPETIRDQARQRWFDMMMMRVEQNAPDEAFAVCVCIIRLPNGGAPIVGCKWAGNGTSVKQPRSGGASAPNPIAESNPTLSVESMAIRRAMRQLVTHISGTSAVKSDPLPNAAAMDDTIDSLNERSAAEPKQREPTLQEIRNAEPPPVLLGSSSDPYSLSSSADRPLVRDKEGVVVPRSVTREPGFRSPLRNVAEQGGQEAGRVDVDKQGTHSVDFAPPSPAMEIAKASGPVATDLFGGESPMEPVSDDPKYVVGVKFKCRECERQVTGPDTNEHEEVCPWYADVAPEIAHPRHPDDA